MVRIYDDGSSYAWTPEMGKEGIVIRMSKSTAGSSNWCVQQMWLQQNFPKEQKLVKHLVVGDDVHNGLDLFYQSLKPHKVETIQRILKNKGDVTEYLMSIVPTRDVILKNRRAENQDFPFYHDDYERNMKWLMEYENARMSMNPDDILPVANEVRLDVRMDFNVNGHGLIPVQFVGIIDRVFRAPGGGLMLFELKTGKWQDSKMSQMRGEMAYYAFLIANAEKDYLIERGLDAPVTHWGWRYSAADNWHIEETKVSSHAAMKKRVHDLLVAYLTQEFPITKDDFKCSYCDYIELCPKYAIQVEDEA